MNTPAIIPLRPILPVPADADTTTGADTSTDLSPMDEHGMVRDDWYPAFGVAPGAKPRRTPLRGGEAAPSRSRCGVDGVPAVGGPRDVLYVRPVPHRWNRDSAGGDLRSVGRAVLMPSKTVKTPKTEHPIIMQAESVLGILSGKKTMTRRILETQLYAQKYHPFTGEFDEDWNAMAVWQESSCLTEIDCPYGAYGENIWVREAFSVSADPHEPDGHYWLTYTADNTRIEIDSSEITMGRLKPGKKYPPIHMFRWASRITLEITDIRVERLNEISEADAIAEGIKTTCPCAGGCDQHRKDYATLWDSINGKKPGHSWADNPWVFAISFKRIESEAAHV